MTHLKNKEGKEAMAGDVNTRKAAVAIIEEAIQNYKDKFC